MPQLDPSSFITQLFWLAVIFSAIYAFMAIYFVPRISKIVDKREERVKDNLMSAQKMVDEQKKIKNKIEKILEKARTKGLEIKKEATGKTEKELHAHITKVDSDLAKKSTKQEEKLLRMKAQISSELPGIAETLSKEMFKTIIDNQDLNKKVAN